MVLVDRALRCCGLVDGCGGALAPASKLVLLTTMMDALADKPDLSDTKLQVEATETAQKLHMLASSKGSLGSGARAVAALAVGGVDERVVGTKPHIRCSACNTLGHYADKCAAAWAAESSEGPWGRGRGMGRGGGGYGAGRGYGRGAGGYGGVAAPGAQAGGGAPFMQGGGQAPFMQGGGQGPFIQGAMMGGMGPQGMM